MSAADPELPEAGTQRPVIGEGAPVSPDVASPPSQDSLGLATKVLRVLVPTTAIVGLLYYFGYICAQSLYLSLRLDETGFRLTTQEYLTRSANVALDGVLIVSVALFVGVALHLLTLKFTDPTRAAGKRRALALAPLLIGPDSCHRP